MASLVILSLLHRLSRAIEFVLVLSDRFDASLNALSSILRFLPFDAQIYEAHAERAANDINNQIGNGRVAAYHE